MVMPAAPMTRPKLGGWPADVTGLVCPIQMAKMLYHQPTPAKAQLNHATNQLRLRMVPMGNSTPPVSARIV